MKLWLDDLRNPADHVGEGWTWAKTTAEAIDTLASRDVELLSLDYDLEPGSYGCPACRGGLDCADHASGYGVVEWLARNPDHWPRTVSVHSANPRGALRMLSRMRALGFVIVDKPQTRW